MNADGTGQLGQSRNGHFYFFACGHDEVCKLIDHQHDVRQVPVPLLWVQLSAYEFGVVLLEVSALGVFQHFIPLVHFQAQRLDGTHHLRVVGDDGLFGVRELGQIMALDVVEQGQLHLLWIHQHKLQLTRVLLVEQRHEHGVQPHRFTLTRGTCHEHVGHFGQVKYIGLIGDGLANRNGQRSIAVLELIAGNEGPHRHHIRV